MGDTDPGPEDGVSGGGVVIDTVTAWASPGLVTDTATTPPRRIAYVTVTFAVTVTTSDPRPGAEPVDALTAALLGRGFTLLTSDNPLEEMQTAPPLPSWWCELEGANQLQIAGPGELFYDGDLGAGVPQQWHATALARGRLIVLAATQLDLHRSDRGEQAHRAQQAGRLVATQVPLRPPAA